MPVVEVCFSPALFASRKIKTEAVTVVVDVLRASSSMAAALASGAKCVIPVAEIELAKKLKAEGFLVAGEREGFTLDFADFGNSPLSFTPDKVAGKSVVFCTTNGTRAIEVAKESKVLVSGAFNHITSLSDWLIKQNMDILILCAGWNLTFSLEDSLFAGALSERLLDNNNFTTRCDSVQASLALWKTARHDLSNFVKKSSHYQRLVRFKMDDSLDYCFTPDSIRVIPYLENEVLIDLNSDR